MKGRRGPPGAPFVNLLAAAWAAEAERRVDAYEAGKLGASSAPEALYALATGRERPAD